MNRLLIILIIITLIIIISQLSQLILTQVLQTIIYGFLKRLITVVPGLESLLTYIQSKYATITALQNSIANINNTINNEIQTLQTEINNIEITPGTGTVSKDLHYIQVIQILCLRKR